ncbi:hypothetical protein I5T97_05475 [Serratia marcescens]|uniref:hypothetical protein n=1 Tax=Serratia nevei TaxID=2703794 RepID=UPI0018D45031|nr:hypothetical protein [Serratia marcescens]MBH2844203.1 hypothetical protein [Serratia marcescens]MBH2863983.1 hypothetical protein [Serratia marcescens]MBN5378632.1 hypothetical protein [Serratia marcescens]
MKARICSWGWRWRYALVSLLAAAACVVAGYFLFFKPQIPECRAVVRIMNQLQGKTTQRVILMSIVPDGARSITVLLNGSYFDGDVRYVISRAVAMDYQRWGNNYTLLVKENIKKPQDTVVKDELNRRLPMAGKQMHLRIERIDQHHYLFIDNHSPLFVCATNS